MIVLTVVATLTAATPISLEEVRAASRQATTAQLSALDHRRAQEQVTIARSQLLPQVGATLQGGYLALGPQQRLTPVETPPGSGSFEQQLRDYPGQDQPSIDFSVGVNQSIFDANLWASLGVANAQEEAAKAQAAEERLAAELEGIRRFYDLMRAQKTQDVIAARVKSSAELAVRAEALYQAGRRRKEDAISAQINLANDRTALVRQQALITQASTALASWIGRPPAETLTAVDPGTLTTDATPVLAFDDALKEAREQRPQLVAMDALSRAAKEGVAAARSLYLPTVGLGASYSRSSADDLRPFFNPERQHTFNAQLTVRWDIFNGFITNAQVGQAKLEEQRAILTLEQARRDVEAQLKFAVDQLSVALDVIELSEHNLKLAADNLALAQARFEEGAGSTLEIRDAQVKHTSAELQLLESRIDTELARAGLERAIGAFGPGEAQ